MRCPPRVLLKASTLGEQSIFCSVRQWRGSTPRFTLSHHNIFLPFQRRPSLRLPRLQNGHVTSLWRPSFPRWDRANAINFSLRNFLRVPTKATICGRGNCMFSCQFCLTGSLCPCVDPVLVYRFLIVFFCASSNTPSSTHRVEIVCASKAASSTVLRTLLSLWRVY